MNNCSLSSVDNNYWGALIYNEKTDDGFLISNGVLLGYRGNAEILSMPDNILSINSYAFQQNKHIRKVIVGKNVNFIGDRAFDECTNLEEVEFLGATHGIGNQAFWHCSSLCSIELPSDIEYIGEGLFMECINLKHVKLPQFIDVIPDVTFFHCQSLEEIVIPNNVWLIGSDAFDGCSHLKEITLPKVEYIDEYAFIGCHSLESLYIESSYMPLCDMSAYTSVQWHCTLFVPRGCKSSYEKESPWSSFGAIKEYDVEDKTHDGTIDAVDIVRAIEVSADVEPIVTAILKDK